MGFWINKHIHRAKRRKLLRVSFCKKNVWCTIGFGKYFPLHSFLLEYRIKHLLSFVSINMGFNWLLKNWYSLRPTAKVNISFSKVNKTTHLPHQKTVIVYYTLSFCASTKQECDVSPVHGCPTRTIIFYV